VVLFLDLPLSIVVEPRWESKKNIPMKQYCIMTPKESKKNISTCININDSEGVKEEYTYEAILYNDSEGVEEEYGNLY